jgi:hypothetical protein
VYLGQTVNLAYADLTKPIIYIHVHVKVIFAGRLHPAMVEICEREPVAATFIRYGLWPTRATKQTVGVSIDLLKMMHILTLECAVSVKGFTNSIRWMHNLTSKEVINRFLE